VIWAILYILGILGFGGVLFALGRQDHSWPVLTLMAIGWLPLIIGLGFIALVAKLLGDIT
jgi:hypothetical protein